MPTTIVMTMLMFCLPGSTRRANAPMMMPVMIAPMMIPMSSAMGTPEELGWVSAVAAAPNLAAQCANSA